ncbi:MAG: 2',3'-cyclic-nucleotide 2'-phosphodiesterase/3'-nucleotidase/5'-nucleotidase, partial [Ilumatobacter sp.]
YMPDTISAADIGGATYLVTANEGDSRDYDCYSEEERVKDFALASPPYAVGDEADSNLGRLKTTSAFPSVIDGGELQQVFAYGARSFTIWDTVGNVVFDSGDQIEQQLVGTGFFNLDGDETDGRSDDKGPEPEAVATGVIDGRTFAFIGLERSGGVMMYDISDPANATFVDYLNTAEETGVGDVSPEGISFIAEEDSPTGEPLLAVSFEVSGTTRLMQVNTDEPPVTATPTTEPVKNEPVTTAAMPTATPSIPAPTTSSVPTAVTNVLPETGGESGGLLTAATLTSILGILCFWLARRPFRQTN